MTRARLQLRKECNTAIMSHNTIIFFLRALCAHPDRTAVHQSPCKVLRECCRSGFYTLRMSARFGRACRRPVRTMASSHSQLEQCIDR
jgi:hypothetical protein